MITIREAVQDFRASESRSGFISDDTSLSDQYIYNLLLQERALFYKQKGQARQMFSPEVYQTLCLDMITADKVDCPRNPPAGCSWQMSSCELPAFLNIKSVTNDIGSVNFSHVTWNNASTIKTGRIKSSRKAKYYTIKQTTTGLRLFVLNDAFLKSVSIEAILEDPLKGVDTCSGKNDGKCHPFDQLFYVSRDEQEVILKLAIDSYVRMLQLQKVDVVNNDKPDQ